MHNSKEPTRLLLARLGCSGLGHDDDEEEAAYEEKEEESETRPSLCARLQIGNGFLASSIATSGSGG